MVVASKYDRMLLHGDFNEYFGLYLIDGSKPSERYCYRLLRKGVEGIKK
jgi:hypothetical protein